MNDLRPGECGKVIDVRGGGMFLRRRLLEMGILGGTHFKVQRIAPLGDPMEIRLRGSSISLRLREAHHIVVERV
jgi:ferrous iron transport protein A